MSGVGLAKNTGAPKRPGIQRDRPAADRRGTISQRLGYLFETVHAPGRRPFSAAQVARWINDNDGKISSVYILKILSGDRSEPSPRNLKSLAAFFCVSPSFFFEDEPAEIDGNALHLQILLRDERVLSMMVRYSQLSERSQDAISDIIDSLLQSEGKAAE